MAFRVRRSHSDLKCYAGKWRAAKAAGARCAFIAATILVASFLANSCHGAPVAQVAGQSASAALAPYGGERPPELRLPVLDGPEFSLSDRKGRVVLVHFFATWCEPCREELPALSRLAARHAGKVEVVGVDVAEVDVRVRRFFETLPVGFPIALDRDRSTTRAWAISALPTTVVLDRDLVPRFIAVGDVAWDDPVADGVITGLMTMPSPATPPAVSAVRPATIQPEGLSR